MEREFVAPVHRCHEGAAIAVEAIVHPRLGVWDAGVEIGRAEIDRQHATAHEIALHPGLTAIGDAERLTNHRTRPVGANQEVGPDLKATAIVGTLDVADDAVIAFDVTDEPLAIIQLDAGQPFGVAA